MAGRKLTLIVGGASSGKSLIAEKMAANYNSVAYIATALPIDTEMSDKIAAHRRRRPAAWATIEVGGPILQDVLSQLSADLAIVDSLTLYAAGVLTAAEDPAAHMFAVADGMRLAPCDLIVVTDEVGLGIVPGSPEGRAYMTLLGKANQYLAGIADNVYFVAAGLPMTLKGENIEVDSIWV